ncbi:hypothetical protein BRAS3843_2000002 [Bradyrhizobium sp. STM 3843]|nr:hypothetical protein BRAS3843_2000002 [Bradyrhizobium sp. STM 3843]
MCVESKPYIPYMTGSKYMETFNKQPCRVIFKPYINPTALHQPSTKVGHRTGESQDRY